MSAITDRQRPLFTVPEGIDARPIYAACEEARLRPVARSSAWDDARLAARIDLMVWIWLAACVTGALVILAVTT